MPRAAVSLGIVAAMAVAFVAVGGMGAGARDGGRDDDKGCNRRPARCTPTRTVTRTSTVTVGGETVLTTITETLTDRSVSTVDLGELVVSEGTVTDVTGTRTTITGAVTVRQTATRTVFEPAPTTTLTRTVLETLTSATTATVTETSSELFTSTVETTETEITTTSVTSTLETVLECYFTNGALDVAIPGNAAGSCPASPL